MNKIKEVILVTLVSIIFAILALLAVQSIISEPTTEYVASKTTPFMIALVATWIFSSIPSYIFFFKYLDKKSFEKAFETGYWLGLIFGFFAFFIPVVVAPFFMIRYYVSLFTKKKEEYEYSD